MSTSTLPPPGSFVNYTSLQDPSVYKFSTDDEQKLYEELLYFLDNIFTEEKLNMDNLEAKVPYGWGMAIFEPDDNLTKNQVIQNLYFAKELIVNDFSFLSDDVKKEVYEHVDDWIFYVSKDNTYIEEIEVSQIDLYIRRKEGGGFDMYIVSFDVDGNMLEYSYPISEDVGKRFLLNMVKFHPEQIKDTTCMAHYVIPRFE